MNRVRIDVFVCRYVYVGDNYEAGSYSVNVIK